MPNLVNPYRLAVDFDHPMTRSGYISAHRANAVRLASYWQDRGVDLNHYNTVESAHDVNDLRKALGVDRINLHGASYGSHLGLAVIKAHAEVVDRAILCLVEGLNDTHKLPANTDRHFDHLADLARSDPGLGGQCPDLVGELRGVLADYEARPETLALPSLERSIEVGKFDLQLLLDSGLGSIRAIRGLPAFVRQLAKRDLAWKQTPKGAKRTEVVVPRKVGVAGPEVDPAHSAAKRRAGFGALSMVARRLDRRLPLPGIHGMMLAMDAASGASPERIRQIEAERREALLDDAFNLPFPCVGDVIGVDDLGAGFRTPVQAQTPTLFCCGTLDGRTPISNARAVMRGFPNAHLIVVEGASHETPRSAARRPGWIPGGRRCPGGALVPALRLRSDRGFGGKLRGCAAKLACRGRPCGVAARPTGAIENASAFSDAATKAVLDSRWATARVAPRVPGMGMN